MANGIECKCSRCGYSNYFIFGVGFNFPEVYAEVLTEIRKGTYGDFAQKFITEHPDGAVDCEEVALQCPKCHALANDTDLTMYVPKDNYIPEPRWQRWCVAKPMEKSTYVDSCDLKENYKEYAKYNHVCHKCASKMQILDERSFETLLDKHKLKCPECGKALDRGGFLFCD